MGNSSLVFFLFYLAAVIVWLSERFEEIPGVAVSARKCAVQVFNVDGGTDVQKHSFANRAWLQPSFLQHHITHGDAWAYLILQ